MKPSKRIVKFLIYFSMGVCIWCSLIGTLMLAQGKIFIGLINLTLGLINLYTWKRNKDLLKDINKKTETE